MGVSKMLSATNRSEASNACTERDNLPSTIPPSTMTCFGHWGNVTAENALLVGFIKFSHKNAFKYLTMDMVVRL